MNIFLARPSAHSSVISGMLIVILIGILIGILALSSTKLWLSMEQSTSLKVLFLLRGPRVPPEGVQVVAINSAASQALDLPQHSPSWSREVYAKTLTKLAQAGAELIIVDINFKEARDQKQDTRFAHALKNAGNVILVTYLKRQQIKAGSGFIDIEEEMPPLSLFAKHALGYGPFTLPKYPANVAYTNLIMNLSAGQTPSQPLVAYRILKGQEPPFINLNKPIYINYYGSDRTIQTHNIDFILNSSHNQLSTLYKGNIVYLGYSDAAQTEQIDAYHTVFSSDTGVDLSGVEISATVLANLLDQSYILAISQLQQIAIGLCIFLLCALSAYYLNFFQASLIQLLALATLYTIAYSQFVSHYYWYPLMLPTLICISTNIVLALFKYQAQKQYSHAIGQAIANYLPNEAAEKLSHSIAKMDSQHRIVSGICLMSDIRGYTTLCEEMPPHELHQLMNRYYKVLLQEVEQRGGMIGNIVGDSMLSLWTAANIDSDMCIKAIDCAKGIHETLKLHQEFSLLPTCFAIHGGTFSLGNLGAQGHFEFSPVGDIVNTTSRIEPFNRKLGTTLLCSKQVQQLLVQTKYEYMLRALGSFDMHNKSSSFELFAVNLSQSTVNEAEEILRLGFAEALSAWQRKDWGTALTLFSKLTEAYPNDGPSHYYLTQAQTELTQAHAKLI